MQTYDDVLRVVRGLSPADKARLLEDISAALRRDLDDMDVSAKPKRSLLGLWQSVNVSEEDIAETRQEMWGNFPRGDV